MAERIQSVLAATQTAGFANLENFVSTYYTCDLTSAPHLANTRRLSRNRGLPGILAEVREDVGSWTEWETQRYRDEVLRSAEGVLKSECVGVLENTKRRGRLEEVVAAGRSSTLGGVAEISTVLQSEVCFHRVDLTLIGVG